MRDFGYSKNKAKQKLEKLFGGKTYEELNEEEKAHYDKIKIRNEAFDEWFVKHSRDIIIDCITKACEYIFIANSIYPSIPEELVERRIYQDKAIGQCYRLLQELQYTIETLPVSINRYMSFIEGIEKEIKLLKGWRKGDNKYKKNFNK